MVKWWWSNVRVCVYACMWECCICIPPLSLHSLWWYKRIFTPLRRWSVPAIVRDTDLIHLFPLRVESLLINECPKPLCSSGDCLSPVAAHRRYKHGHTPTLAFRHRASVFSKARSVLPRCCQVLLFSRVCVAGFLISVVINFLAFLLIYLLLFVLFCCCCCCCCFLGGVLFCFVVVFCGYVFMVRFVSFPPAIWLWFSLAFLLFVRAFHFTGDNQWCIL